VIILKNKSNRKPIAFYIHSADVFNYAKAKFNKIRNKDWSNTCCFQHSAFKYKE